MAVRGFVHYNMKPIETMFLSVMQNQTDKFEKLMAKLDIKVPADAKDLTGKALLKRIMQVRGEPRVFSSCTCLCVRALAIHCTSTFSLYFTLPVFCADLDSCR